MITKARLTLGLFILLLIIGAFSYLVYAPLPVYEVENPAISFVATKERIAEGKRIALTICIHCHYNYETGTLAGRQHGNPKRVGNFYSGNITNDSATGIGGWSVSELYYFLKIQNSMKDIFIHNLIQRIKKDGIVNIMMQK